jgi:uncharacterized protein (TIGR00369 family)
VCAAFCCGHTLQGYQDYLHGGVIASLLDGAMTNCLFAHGQIALTAELKIRFLHPVMCEHAGLVRAWIDRSHDSLQVLKGEVAQGGQVKARATGKFIRQPNLAGVETSR